MAKDFIHLMHTLFLPGISACKDTGWCPAADVYRNRKGWLVKFDLAGVRPEDVELTAEDGRLIIRGLRRDWCVEEGCSCYHMEIAYSHFERSLALPCDLEGAEIVAEHREGMLLVRIQTEGGK